jgi:hypothetical protein
MLLIVVALVLMPSLASAQAVVAFEMTYARQDAPASPVKVSTTAAINVTCTDGQLTVPISSVWLAPNAAFTVEFEIEQNQIVRVCRYQAPASELASLATGVLYTVTAKLINEAGLKSEVASPASNPFGVVGTPANIRRVGVGK